MTKRSRTVALCILGAAAFTLSGCREEQVDAQAFPDLESCKEAAAGGDGLLTAADCEAAIAEAEQLHVETAPRYDSLEVCESQHGEGACGSEEAVASGGSGSIFMPLLTGYLIGNMLSGRGGYARSQPMYRTADGKFANASGSNVYSGNSGKAKLGANQFTKPPTTIGKTPMTKASVASRGGFGKTGGARGGYGG
ncbi:DUF1190 domain-containing protein [Tropicimonas sp. TH_r6]|uniref:DUF1190 domain-containing protein n=1 Tax=Tropicimonas sp. TH_r6 TaxID=3082085 RepID=UPI002952CC73|nr:DUF1190 domain-containing protein [Tropicimonas sp. TH_r6]MDV7143873.1 DUF1190 domain-containing protein [Tropicimonas sp. TH_r6]